MTAPETVDVPRDSFRFCRFSLAVLMWVGVLSRTTPTILLCWLIMVASAAFTVRRAPLIWLWTTTVHRLKPSPPQPLEVAAMRFAHTLAAVLIGLPLLLLATGAEGAVEPAWKILWVVTIFKTIAAANGCPASKLYSCVRGGGTCCAFLKR